MRATDEHAIAVLGETELPYLLRRTGRRKTIALAIDADSGLVVTAPRRASRAEIDALVRRKRRWIEEKLRQVRDAALRYRPRAFADGEPCLYLGRRHRLQVVEGAAMATRILDGHLHAAIPSGLAPEMRRAAVREAMEAWYRERAGEMLPARVRAWHRHFTAEPPRVIVKDQRRRWGSCDARGTLRLNWRLVQAPLEQVDYVVVHELAHILHRGHQPDFWQAVGRAMPDYAQHRDALRRLEPALVW